MIFDVIREAIDDAVDIASGWADGTWECEGQQAARGTSSDPGLTVKKGLRNRQERECRMRVIADSRQREGKRASVEVVRIQGGRP